MSERVSERLAPQVRRRFAAVPRPYYFLIEKVSPGDRSGLREASPLFEAFSDHSDRAVQTGRQDRRSSEYKIQLLGRAPRPYYFLIEKVSPGDRSGLREASPPFEGFLDLPDRAVQTGRQDRRSSE